MTNNKMAILLGVTYRHSQGKYYVLESIGKILASDWLIDVVFVPDEKKEKLMGGFKYYDEIEDPNVYDAVLCQNFAMTCIGNEVKPRTYWFYKFMRDFKGKVFTYMDDSRTVFLNMPKHLDRRDKVYDRGNKRWIEGEEYQKYKELFKDRPKVDKMICQFNKHPPKPAESYDYEDFVKSTMFNVPIYTFPLNTLLGSCNHKLNDIIYYGHYRRDRAALLKELLDNNNAVIYGNDSAHFKIENPKFIKPKDLPLQDMIDGPLSVSYFSIVVGDAEYSKNGNIPSRVLEACLANTVPMIHRDFCKELQSLSLAENYFFSDRKEMMAKMSKLKKDMKLYSSCIQELRAFFDKKFVVFKKSVREAFSPL